MLVELLNILHNFIWVFVMVAFVNKKTAYYNIYFVIPIIYITQILPFHILITLKEKVDPAHHKERIERNDEMFVFPKIFSKIQATLKKYCFASPLTGQGMLIFGFFTCIFVLYPPHYLKTWMHK